MTVGEGASLAFALRTSTEDGYDDLDLLIDGTIVDTWTGATPWTEVTFPLDPGTHDIEWRFSKDGSDLFSVGADLVGIDQITFNGGCQSDNECTVGLGTATACVFCPLPAGGACAEDNPCGTGMCDGSGECMINAVEDGTSCDADGNDCTTDTCQSGACEQEPLEDCSSCGDGSVPSLCASAVCTPIVEDFFWGFEGMGVPGSFALSGDGDWFVDNEEAYEGTRSLRSAPIGDSEQASVTLEVDIAAEAQISFFLRTDTESADDLEFYIDGSFEDDWDSDTSWRSVSYTLAAGSHTLEWRYAKDVSVSTNRDSVWIDNVQLGPPCADGNTCTSDAGRPGACAYCPRAVGEVCNSDNVCAPGTCDDMGECVIDPVDDGTTCDIDDEDCTTDTCQAGECTPTNNDDCSECGDGSRLALCASGACEIVGARVDWDFESDDFPMAFETSGDADWLVDTSMPYSGTRSLRSGDIGDSEASSVTLTHDFPDGGEIGFWLRVESESGFDDLNFRIDGTLEDSWDGDVNWRFVSYTVGPGEHTFEWEYDKDSSTSIGADSAWIDDVYIDDTGMCNSMAECTASIADGMSCLECPVPDATPCTGGACNAGMCEGP